ncbi:MAG: YraN family protein [Christensenellaceae bacterium]|jgi:putative endonuclease
MDKRQLGKKGEQLAAAYLQERGMILLRENYQIRGGEIDLIMQDGETLVFVEVKTRRSQAFGRGVEAIHAKKMQAMRRTAEQYIYENALQEMPMRFDVIEIFLKKETTEIQYIKNADIHA